MAAVTYLIRVIPFLLFKKQIKNVYIQSFLYYVPYVILSAMAFPAILTSTGCVWAGLTALCVIAVLSFMQKPMILSVIISGACALAVQIISELL